MIDVVVVMVYVVYVVVVVITVVFAVRADAFTFLDASTHLYVRVCPTVGWSVGPSVGWWVTRFFQTAEFEWKWHINHRISIEFKL